MSTITIYRDTSINALSDTPDAGTDRPVVEQNIDQFLSLLTERAAEDGITLKISDNGGWGQSYVVDPDEDMTDYDLHNWYQDNGDFWAWYN